jgi:RNA polymerase sigma factor (sigma-70 family)
MLRVKAGEIEVLGLLFEKYKKPLFGFFYRNIHNPSICEDLVQNVFYRILKYRNNFVGYGKFTTWMYHIAHNVFIDHNSKKFQNNNADEITDFDPEDNQYLEDIIINNEKVRLLNIALKKLVPEQREILILSKYQELKYKEIAEILDCSEGAVKVRIFRALNELKKHYFELNGETL